MNLQVFACFYLVHKSFTFNRPGLPRANRGDAIMYKRYARVRSPLRPRRRPNRYTIVINQILYKIPLFGMRTLLFLIPFYYYCVSLYILHIRYQCSLLPQLPRTGKRYLSFRRKPNDIS